MNEFKQYLYVKTHRKTGLKYLGKIAGAGNTGGKQSLEHKIARGIFKRKSYLINDEIIVENALEYCRNNNLSYSIRKIRKNI